MSINAKLFSYCIAFCLMVAGLAWASYTTAESALRLGAEAPAATRAALVPLYDAQRRAALMVASLEDDDRPPLFSDLERAILRDDLRAIVSGLSTAAANADSPAAKAAVGAVLDLYMPLNSANGDLTRRLLTRMLQSTEEAFDGAILSVWADAEAAGQATTSLVEHRLWQGLAALAACLSTVLVGAIWVSTEFAGGLRKARRIADSIASGHFDVAIPRQSSIDFEALFLALRKIRAGVIEHIRRHESHMMVQASSFDTTIETQHHRFVAAVNNMSQGLCMLDRDHRYVAFNEPFSLLFPHFKPDATAEDIQSDPGFSAFLAPHPTGTFIHKMPGGPMLQVKRRGVKGGGLVMTFEDITEQFDVQRQLEHFAGHDALTDLPNRRLFRERLGKALAQPRRAVAIFLLDLDKFKVVNDSFGHPTGDALLVAVSRRLMQCCGPKAFLARLGGNEFALFLAKDVRPGMAERFAQSLVDAFEPPFEVEGRALVSRVSIGVFELAAGAARGVTADIALQNCDLALYRAKSEGRSGYRFYEAGMRESIAFRRDIEIEMRQALERGEFELNYQPFVDIDARAVSGFEALLRWRHPVRGVLLPSQFIPIAEELGLIKEIGIWALGEACEEAARWPRHLTLSVNLSPLQFRDPNLVVSVEAALKRSRIEPGRLHLEVTESLFLDNGENVLAVLAALRGLGARISMDDFGTGYSSLGYLTRFPFDKLKIDQSFVREIGKPESMAVIRAVIGLSCSMNMSVIAEGIETTEQYHLLVEEGCREMQGYLFGRPSPASELPQLIASLPKRWDMLTKPRRREPRKGSRAA